VSIPELLKLTDHGLYCEDGDFHVDPWRGVDRALITHAHADHTRWGSKNYLCSDPSKGLLKVRLSQDAKIESLPFGETKEINGVKISFHPAGHLLGSAQVRLEKDGVVWVVSGDYKREVDKTCEPFELVMCDGFITETTFGLPIYRWQKQEEIFQQINEWWVKNNAEGRTSLLFGYALGKSQRLLGGLDSNIGPILVHGSVSRLNPVYEQAGIDLPKTLPASVENAKMHKGKSIVIAPPSALGTTWVRKFAPYSTAFASGWMAVRGRRRNKALDRGFIMSDHIDWPDLMKTIEETGAEKIWTTHGQSDTVAKHLSELGYDAKSIETRFTGEGEEDDKLEEEA